MVERSDSSGDPAPSDVSNAEVSNAGPPDGTRAPCGDVPTGLDLARRALAAAKAEAARRGQRPGAAAGGAESESGGAERRRRGGRVGEQRSGARPDDRDPQPLGTAVRRLLADRGWQTEVSVGAVLGRWAEVVGPELAAHCTPERFADGELSVRADSTAWATQVRLLAPRLVERLNAEVGAAALGARAGSGTVVRLRVLGPAGPSWRSGSRAVRGRGPRDTYG